MMRALPWADMFEPFGLDYGNRQSMQIDRAMSIVVRSWQPERLQ